jgi:hypothetical protein
MELNDFNGQMMAVILKIANKAAEAACTGDSKTPARLAGVASTLSEMMRGVVAAVTNNWD